MGYDVNYSKNIEMQIKLDNFLAECAETLDIMETVLLRIAGTGSLKCKAKTALSAYINDVILGVMIPATKAAMGYLSTEVSCYVFEMYDYDNDEHAIIQEDFLNALNEKLSSLGTDVLDILGCCKTVAGNVSDIMALDLKSADNMGDAYAGLSEMVLKTRDDIGGYLETFQNRAGYLHEAMSAFYTTVSNYTMGSVDMAAYAGEYHNNTSLEELQPKLIKYVENIGYTQEEIEQVAELKDDVITAYLREKEGEQKLLRIGFLVVGAVSLICPFAMGFTLSTTIASLSISSIAIVYNADQVYQGVQLMDAAESRDTDAEIDTLVHFDNKYMQQAYEVVGKFATSYTCSLVSVSIGSGAGGGQATFGAAMNDVMYGYMGDMISDGIELMTGQSNIMIDFLTGLLAEKIGGSVFGDLPSGHVPSRSVDIDIPNGSRAVANIADDININRVIANAEGAGVDLPDGKVGVKTGIGGGSKTVITPELEEKILLGQRKNSAKNELIGGHSPDINNYNSNYAVEVLQTNPDGTLKVKFVKQYGDGNLSNIKTSTLFPESWSNEKIINSIKTVGNSSPIGIRSSDGAMLYRGIIDGVQIEVIKIGDIVTSGYPTGGVKTGLLPGFSSLE